MGGEFCKQFNEKSEKMYVKDTPLGVRLSALSDRTFTFEIRSPTTAYLVKKAAGINKGPDSPNLSDGPSGYITPECVYEISKIKQKDDACAHLPLESIVRSVIGTCKSIGIKVQEEGVEMKA